MNLWWYLIFSLAERPTHLRDIRPNNTTWIGETYSHLKGMGDVCLITTREWHIYIVDSDTANICCLLTNNNPRGKLTMNGLYIAA